MTTTITAAVATDDDGRDLLCIFGAIIADPDNDPAVSWDDDGQPVFGIEVDGVEYQGPCLDALEEHGLVVVGVNMRGEWLVEQDEPLRSRRAAGDPGGALSRFPECATVTGRLQGPRSAAVGPASNSSKPPRMCRTTSGVRPRRGRR